MDFDTEDRESRTLLRDLQTPRPAIYWLDLILSSCLGWVAFAQTVLLPVSPLMFLWAAIAVFALYRSLCFIHEISHIKRHLLRGFEPAWNLLAGFPLLMPSFVYVGVHQAHHSLSTYGTNRDPEYLPFAKSNRMTAAFALQSFFIPVALLIRFLVLTPAGFLVPPFHRWLVAHASALTMNIAYTREATPALQSRIRRDSAYILALWAAALIVLPRKAFLVWLGVVAIASFINTLRTLAAHKYESEGEPLDRGGQLSDSIDVPGAPWTELWAPVGLRYHALHHYFPGVPYHHLPEAHRRLVESLPLDSAYRAAGRRGLLDALTNLYATGRTGNPPAEPGPAIPASQMD